MNGNSEEDVLVENDVDVLARTTLDNAPPPPPLEDEDGAELSPTSTPNPSSPPVASAVAVGLTKELGSDASLRPKNMLLGEVCYC